MKKETKMQGIGWWIRNDKVGTEACKWRKKSLQEINDWMCVFIIIFIMKQYTKIRFHLRFLGNFISCFNAYLTETRASTMLEDIITTLFC